MTGKPLGSVRRSQIITTYGVGSLVAVGGESFMIAGIEHWEDPPGAEDQLIHEPRLERDLRVNGFRLPPASESESHGDVPVVRFPAYHFCPESGVLAKYGDWGRPSPTPKCQVHDERVLVPSRFVMACRRGHIDDFPYFRWVHAGTVPDEMCRGELTLRTSGRSAALRDIEIRCNCGKKRTMEGALGGSALKGVSGCTGRRPWLGREATESCDEMPRATQRGASGVWLSDVASAIHIPPWSEGAHRIVGRHWRALGHTSDPRRLVEEMRLATREFSVDDLVHAVEQRKRTEAGEDDGHDGNRRTEEYRALSRTTRETSRDQTFVCVPASQRDASLDTSMGLDRIMRVERLREVRVLRGFTRLGAPSPVDREDRLASLHLSEDPPGWLPAIEVIGEGVFLTLNHERLSAWEKRLDVRARADLVDAAYQAQFPVATECDRKITPRMLLVHTLSHVLIQEWSLDCGYPASALRERIFVSEADGDELGMAGILLYTATSDSAGSLGGIVAQSDPERLHSSMARALDHASWCSADPLCVESTASGTNSLNLAACHACLLLPETSCEEGNSLLDRGLLIGTPKQPDLSYFSRP
ncbi:DrmB family protein [Streptomyces cacaoi]